MNNRRSDVAPVLDTGDSIVGLLGSVSTDLTNAQAPIIRGRLNLTAGDHVFDVSGSLYEGLSIEAEILGPGGFIKTGNAALLLQNSNRFLGQVIVDGRVLDVRDDHALGGGAATGIGGGALTLRNVAIGEEQLFALGRGTLGEMPGSVLTIIGVSSWAGPVVLHTNLVVTGDMTFTGPISGAGGLGCFGGGTVRLGGTDANTYTGTTLVRCPLLELDKPFGVRAYSGPSVVGGGFGVVAEVRWLNSYQNPNTPLTLYANGLVNLNDQIENFGPITFHGGRVETGAGFFISENTITANPANTTAIMNGNLSLGVTPAYFIISNGVAEPDLWVNAIIQGADLRKQGPGTLLFTAPNEYVGDTLVEDGILHADNPFAFGTISGITIVEPAATIRLGGIDGMVEAFHLNGSGFQDTNGALQVAGNGTMYGGVVLSSPSTINTLPNGALVIYSAISGTGPLTKSGRGNLFLSGGVPNTYSGGTLHSAGTLQLAKNQGIIALPGNLTIGPASSPVTARWLSTGVMTPGAVATVNGNGLLDLNGNNQLLSRVNLNDGGGVQTGAGTLGLVGSGLISVGSLNPSGSSAGSTITGNLGITPNDVLVFAVAAFVSPSSTPELDVTANIYANGPENPMLTPAGINKQGPGQLRLSGDNTLGGWADVYGGTLWVDAEQPQSPVQLYAGTLLKGSGTVGSILLNGSASRIAPGSSPGILTCGNFNAGAFGSGTLVVELNGTIPGSGHDQVDVRGTVTLTGLTLQPLLHFTSAVGDRFAIINNDGTDAVMGTFTELPQDATLSVGSALFQISYTGGTGNDVVLTRLVTPPLTLTTLPATETPNYALDFDGLDDRVQAATNSFPAVTNSFTVELWANPTGFRIQTAEVDTGISDINQRFAVFPDHGDLGYGANHVCAGLSVGANGISVYEHAVNYLPSLLVYSSPISDWTHVALVYENRQPRLYVNGLLVRTGLTSMKTFVHPSANLGGSIHALGYGPYQGQLDEVRIWNRALNETEVTGSMNGRLTGTEPGLVAYYRCDENSGTSTADSAPALPNNSGALADGAAFVLSGALPPDTIYGPAVSLNGLVNPGGVAGTVWFEWGATTNYGNVTAAQAVPGGVRNTSFFQFLTELSAGAYHFRAAGSNSLNVYYGLDQRFTLLHGTPLLHSETSPGGPLRLSWPTNGPPFRLQSNTSLNPASWVEVPPPYPVVGSNRVVTIAKSGPAQFYRLINP